jgi:hypothetical protein
VNRVVDRESVCAVAARVRRVARDPEREAAHQPVGAFLALAMGRALGELSRADGLEGRGRLGDGRRGRSDARRRSDPPGESDSDHADQDHRRHPQRDAPPACRADRTVGGERVSRGR